MLVSAGRKTKQGNGDMGKSKELGTHCFLWGDGLNTGRDKRDVRV